MAPVLELPCCYQDRKHHSAPGFSVIPACWLTMIGQQGCRLHLCKRGEPLAPRLTPAVTHTSAVSRDLASLRLPRGWVTQLGLMRELKLHGMNFTSGIFLLSSPYLACIRRSNFIRSLRRHLWLSCDQSGNAFGRPSPTPFPPSPASLDPYSPIKFPVKTFDSGTFFREST